MAIAARSSVYRTEPQGVKDQPWFANQVLGLYVSSQQWDAPGLLAALKQIERDMGRESGYRWGPRLIDLDLLLFGNEVVEAEGIQVPHPRLRERAFVLVPLAEIAPDLEFPDGEHITRALQKISFDVKGEVIRQA